ncbi:MAG: diaminopimelate epimerase [Pseudobdellovibrionaceae bacterium]
MKALTFTKMSGAGNTFLIVDARSGEVRSKLQRYIRDSRADLAQELCEGSKGAQADGLIFLEESKSYDFRWDFYNSDGSHAEMCGNAARCVTRYFIDHGNEKKNKVVFESVAGEIEGVILSDGRVQVTMPEFKIENAQMQISVGTYTENAFWVNTGVPHLVVEEKNGLRPERLREKAKGMRFYPGLGPAGANATFYHLINGEGVEAITFERGVEDFTMACGTGAVAVAIAVQKGNFSKKEIKISVPGGDLYVSYDDKKNKPLLTGEAEYLCDIQFY